MRTALCSDQHVAESSVYQRYVATAQAFEPALCCSAKYLADVLRVFPEEIIERYERCDSSFQGSVVQIGAVQ